MLTKDNFPLTHFFFFFFFMLQTLKNKKNYLYTRFFTPNKHSVIKMKYIFIFLCNKIGKTPNEPSHA